MRNESLALPGRSPVSRRVGRDPSNHARGGENRTPAPRARKRHRDGYYKPVAAFVGALPDPAITPGPRRTEAPLPCSAPAGRKWFLPAPTCRTLPVSRVCSRTNGRGEFLPRRLPESRPSHRANKRPSQVSGGLLPAGHVASGMIRRPTPYVRVSPRHSRRTRSRALSSSRTQKLSTTPRSWALRSSAPSPSGLTGKRFFISRLSWLSSFRPPFIGRSPGLIGSAPVPFLAEVGGPHASRVVRAHVLSPYPHGRDSHPLCATTASSLRKEKRHVPVAPVQGTTPSDRTPGLSPLLRDEAFGGLYPGEPPSIWASTSRRTQLYGPLGIWNSTADEAGLPCGVGDKSAPRLCGFQSAPVSMTSHSTLLNRVSRVVFAGKGPIPLSARTKSIVPGGAAAGKEKRFSTGVFLEQPESKW